MSKALIGVLPFYLELYDLRLPEVRPRVEKFAHQIASEVASRGFDVFLAPVCRLKEEFGNAVDRFDGEGVDAILTLHLAYSPSLESAEILGRTRTPIVVLDTSPSFAFGPDQDAGQIMFNHGIHGVQDLCNMLVRLGKPFLIEAGHWERSDVLDRIAGDLRQAAMASAMAKAKVGLIGEPFKGMGDFHVPADELKQAIGIEVLKVAVEKVAEFLDQVSEDEIEREMCEDSSHFELVDLQPELHRSTAQACLALRKWLSNNGASSLSMNVRSFSKAADQPTVR
ncbi:MAG: hypothetical protein QW566_08850, partial [Candidatus Jordarchaeales archaeon]